MKDHKLLHWTIIGLLVAILGVLLYLACVSKPHHRYMNKQKCCKMMDKDMTEHKCMMKKMEMNQK